MFITVWIVSAAALSRGFLDERLNIYQYTNEQAMLEYVPRGQMDARAQFNCSGAETSTPCPYFLCVFPSLSWQIVVFHNM